MAEKLVTVEHLARIVEWVDYWGAKIRREIKNTRHDQETAKLLGLESDDYVEVHLSEKQAERLADGLEQIAEVLRILIADNQRRNEPAQT